MQRNYTTTRAYIVRYAVICRCSLSHTSLITVSFAKHKAKNGNLRDLMILKTIKGKVIQSFFKRHMSSIQDGETNNELIWN